MSDDSLLDANFIKDPKTGELLAIEHTSEYRLLISQFYEETCQHLEKKPYRVQVANGNLQVRNCCISCGERLGNALVQKDKIWVESLPWLPEILSKSYSSRRSAELREKLLQLARKQYEERGKFTHSYNRYLESPEWHKKRDLVLKRCQNVCEGCGVVPATEVHHIHYDHLFNEFLFELLGLCQDCHKKITSENDKNNSSHEQENVDDIGIDLD